MSKNGSLIDTNLRDLITKQLGGDEAKPILELMNTYMLQNNIIDAPPFMGDGNTKPLLGSGQTKGDWRINLTMPDGQKQDIRPDSALSYTIIKEMLKSGPIRFALEMKRAQMVSVFRNRRSVSAYCKNEEAQQVTEFVIEHVLPFAAFEFTWSALVYGSAFMEQVWETKTLSQLGLDGSKYYTVPKQLNLVPHETIRHIKRTNTGDFDGFVQMADYKLGTYYIISTPNVNAFAPGDVDVKMQDALVIPYNGFSRNLWGESFLYPLYPLWFWYEIIIRCLVRYSELMGDPPRLGKAPSRKKVRLSPSSNDLVDAIDYLLALAVNLTKSNAVVIPSDVDENGRPEWELGYMQTPDRSQPFVQIIELFNQMILRSALSGDRAFTQVAGATGSNALGEVHAEATALHNEMVVSSWLHYLNRYWISNITKYNLGADGVPVWLEIQGLDPREREFLTAIAGIAGNSSTFQEFFFMMDWESLGRMAGLPMLTKDQAAKLKDELSKAEQQKQVEQIQTQNELNIENMKQQAQAEKELGQKPEEKEEPTPLEVQLQIEKLTHGDVPIFFSQDEIKNLFTEKETATPQNFFIPSRPNDKDLASALALAYKYQTIQLFNPLHDTLGRFAAKVGGGIKRGAKAVGKFAKENEAELLTAGILAGAAVAGGVAHHQFRKGLPSKAEYQATFNNQTSLTQKILATPAEYISRKGSYGSLIARSALGAGGLTSSFATESTGGKILGAVLPYTLAPSTFVSLAAGGAIYAKASILGSLATAAFATAVFGATAPAAATLIGGVIVGSAASIIAYQLIDHAGKKFTNAYIKRYAPKDPYHITVTEDDETKKRTFTKFSMDNLGILSLYSFGNLVTTLLEDDNDNLMASVMPLVAMLVFDDRVKKISAPFEIPGFTQGGNEWFLTKDLAPNFIKLWAGDNTELENVQLFNPAHDNLGRFASKSGGGFSLLGGSLDPKRTPKPLQAQRSANKVMQGMGKTFKSGLVKGVKVKACADWDCMKKETGISANALGAYHKGKLVLSPHGLSYSAYDNPKFFNRIVAHEATHARRRSGGGGIEFFSKSQVDLEEGSTELISMGHTKYPYAKSPYIKQMRSVAVAARRGSGGNQARAWQLVSLMHYHNDTDRGLSAYRAYANSDKFNKGSDADVEWLVGSMPLRLNSGQTTQLEKEGDFEKDFETSENEIYRTARKVQKKTLRQAQDTAFPEAKVFDDEELQEA